MGKNVFIVSSTFRKNGNSEILADEFVRGAETAGHIVKKIAIRDMDLKFCIGCMYCSGHDRCVLNDDVNGLLTDVQNADVLVFATPIYYYEMAGQLKTFLDRLNPLFPRENRFKSVYLLTAAADGATSAMDGAIQGVQGWIDCFNGVTLEGVVYGTGVTSAGDVKGTKAVQEAYQMGKNI